MCLSLTLWGWTYKSDMWVLKKKKKKKNVRMIRRWIHVFYLTLTSPPDEADQTQSGRLAQRKSSHLLLPLRLMAVCKCKVVRLQTPSSSCLHICKPSLQEYLLYTSYPPQLERAPPPLRSHLRWWLECESAQNHFPWIEKKKKKENT